MAGVGYFPPTMKAPSGLPSSPSRWRSGRALGWLAALTFLAPASADAAAKLRGKVDGFRNELAEIKKSREAIDEKVIALEELIAKHEK